MKSERNHKTQNPLQTPNINIGFSLYSFDEALAQTQQHVLLKKNADAVKTEFKIVEFGRFEFFFFFGSPLCLAIHFCVKFHYLHNQHMRTARALALQAYFQCIFRRPLRCSEVVKLFALVSEHWNEENHNERQYHEGRASIFFWLCVSNQQWNSKTVRNTKLNQHLGHIDRISNPFCSSLMFWKHPMWTQTNSGLHVMESFSLLFYFIVFKFQWWNFMLMEASCSVAWLSYEYKFYVLLTAKCQLCFELQTKISPYVQEDVNR